MFAQGERIITSLWHFEHADHIDVTGSNSQTVYTFYSHNLNRQESKYLVPFHGTNRSLYNNKFVAYGIQVTKSFLNENKRM